MAAMASSRGLKFSMKLEIQIALNYIISFLYNRLPRQRTIDFGDELEKLLMEKYESHWYPDDPSRGSAYRCIHIGNPMDVIVQKAANISGLSMVDIQRLLPPDIILWIDPNEVSYRIEGSQKIHVLYDLNSSFLYMKAEGNHQKGPASAPTCDSWAQPPEPTSDGESPTPTGDNTTAVSSSPSPPNGKPGTSPSAPGVSSTRKNSNTHNKVTQTSPVHIAVHDRPPQKVGRSLIPRLGLFVTVEKGEFTFFCCTFLYFF
uniref:Anti-proliferative protein domain-containing protein n=1 Tax=Pyxicephalus adspersus TaxID=30357 RepID=A0AAV3ASL0_PYXAD|nr:TPA: hypothetical protein GDO54_007947 [Pyxicephalus adspersus]